MIFISSKLDILFKKIEKNGYASIASIEATPNNDFQFVGFEAVIYTEGYNIESIFYGIAQSESLVTAIPDILENNNIIVYPNPATDFLNIQTKKDIDQIDVYSLSGRLLLSENEYLWSSNKCSEVFLKKIMSPL